MSEFETKKTTCDPAEGTLTAARLPGLDLDSRLSALRIMADESLISSTCAGEQAAQLIIEEYSKFPDTDRVTTEIKAAVQSDQVRLGMINLGHDSSARTGVCLEQTADRPKLTFSPHFSATDGSIGNYNDHSGILFLPIHPDILLPGKKMNCNYAHELAHYDGKMEIGAYKTEAECDPTLRDRLAAKYGHPDIETNILAHLITNYEPDDYVATVLELDEGALTPRVLDLLPGGTRYDELVKERHSSGGLLSERGRIWLNYSLDSSRDGFVSYFSNYLGPRMTDDERIETGLQERIEAAADASFKEARRLRAGHP